MIDMISKHVEYDWPHMIDKTFYLISLLTGNFPRSMASEFPSPTYTSILTHTKDQTIGNN